MSFFEIHTKQKRYQMFTKFGETPFSLTNCLSLDKYIRNKNRSGSPIQSSPSQEGYVITIIMVHKYGKDDVNLRA